MYDITANRWFWVHGSSNVDQLGDEKQHPQSNSLSLLLFSSRAGIYGTMGEGTSSTLLGGRFGSISWLVGDTVWIFGGLGFSNSTLGYLSDLWTYNMSSNIWTWIGGSQAKNRKGVYQGPDYYPGSRSKAVGWVSNNDLWLAFGFGYSNSSFGHLNDMWKYTVSNNTWLWIGGSSATNQNGRKERRKNNSD
jgi:hypothetical protein